MVFTKTILKVKIPPERRNLEFRDCFKREKHLLRPYRYGERNYPQITWISAYCNVPYFFGYKREFFSLPKQSQKSRSILQDGSRSLELFWKGKTCIIAKFHRTDLVIVGHSTEGKTLSYNQINTVELRQ